MDVVAGDVGFFRDFLPSETGMDISFEAIRRIREEYCPNASFQSCYDRDSKGAASPLCPS